MTMDLCSNVSGLSSKQSRCGIGNQQAHAGTCVQASGEDKKLIPVQRHWIYTPFQHSESVPDQKVMSNPDSQ